MVTNLNFRKQEIFWDVVLQSLFHNFSVNTQGIIQGKKTLLDSNFSFKWQLGFVLKFTYTKKKK